MDIDPASPMFPQDPNIKSLVYNSADLPKDLFPENFLDIVVDDGDHREWMQFATFSFLWPKMKSDGLYVIEDIQNKAQFLHVFGNDNTIEIKIVDDKSGEYIAFIKRKK